MADLTHRGLCTTHYWARAQLDNFWRSYDPRAGEIAWARAQLEEVRYQLARARGRAARGERTGAADVAYWLQDEVRWTSYLAQLEKQDGEERVPMR